MEEHKFPCKAIALRDIENEDWKTRTALQQKPIPMGTEITIIKDMYNFYGYWYEVDWNNQYMYIDPDSVKLIEE